MKVNCSRGVVRVHYDPTKITVPQIRARLRAKDYEVLD